jgi:hypothetical protein
MRLHSCHLAFTLLACPVARGAAQDRPPPSATETTTELRRALAEFSEDLDSSPTSKGPFYRLLVRPAFYPPYLIRVEERPYGYFAALRVRASATGNPPRFARPETLVRLTPARWHDFTAAIDSLGLCDLPPSNHAMPLHGDLVFLQVRTSAGQCQLGYWSPMARDTAERTFQAAINQFEALTP